MSVCPCLEDLLALGWGAARSEGDFLHLTRCEPCRVRYQGILEDRAFLVQLPGGNRGVKSIEASARVQGGLAVSTCGFPLRKCAPVFRAGGVPVLHSAIHPMGRDYVLLELSGWDGDLQLHLERGTKNGPAIPISLYMDEELSDQRTLRSRLSYRLTQLAEGRYLLKLQDHPVFRFNVQE